MNINAKNPLPNISNLNIVYIKNTLHNDHDCDLSQMKNYERLYIENYSWENLKKTLTYLYMSPIFEC